MSKYNKNDQVKEDETDSACCTHNRRNVYRILVVEKDH
jgi:hypothetical protein